MNTRIASLILLHVLVASIISYSLTTISYSSFNYRLNIKEYVLGITPPTIDGDPRDWPSLQKLHPPISIDGRINDWYTEYYGEEEDQVVYGTTTNLSRGIYVWDQGNGSYTYYKGEYIWFDAIQDTRTATEYIPWTDLVEIRVTGDNSHLYIMVRVANLETIGNATQPSLLLSIPLDIDMNYTNGNITTVDDETNVSSYAPWDYQVVIDLTNPNVEPNTPIYGDGVEVWNNGSPLDILDPSYSDVSTSNSYFVANPGTDSVEIAVAWSDLGVANPWNVSNVRLYAIAFLGNGYGVPVTNLPGSEALDVLSKDDTDTEVENGVIDYWVDIGFTTACEPTYHYHHVLDDRGFIQAYSDLSNDERTEYVVNEAFDLDIISTTLWIDEANNQLYILVHVKGDVRPRGNVSPAIAIAIDTTPWNLTDGSDSWIAVPPDMVTAPIGTDTELGVPQDWNTTSRSSKWTHIIWIVSKLVGTIPQYWVYVYSNGGTVYESNVTVKGSIHFYEAAVPLDKINPELGSRVFRFEALAYAYVLSTSLLIGIPRDSLLDIQGANVYDTTATYITYSPSGVITVDDKPYAIDAEIYDTDDDPTNDLSTLNGDHWIDTFTTRKYAVRIVNVTLYHRSFDNDSFIEIGEPAWVNATIQYFNGTSWVPFANRYVEFYLVGSRILLGGNYSDANGTVILNLGYIADKVKPGIYYLEAVYSPSGHNTIYYVGVSNRSSTTYTILHQPFTTVLYAPYYLGVIVLAVLTIILLVKRYSHIYG